MAIVKKVKAIFRLMQIFLEQKEISKSDEYILDEFGCDAKTLERYLTEIEQEYSHIITIKKGKEKVWKLEKISDIFEEFIKNSDDISNLFLMAQDYDPDILKELEKGTLSKIAKKDQNIFLFKNSIMEDIKDNKQKNIFNNLKSAIKNKEYRNIDYYYNKDEFHKDVKCLKLVFMDNNWYLSAIIKNENNKDEHKFIRLSFIKNISYSEKNSFQTKDIQKYLDFLATAQNSLSVYGVEKKTAKIKATGYIAKYFDDGMKKFLSSQKFEKKCDDGSIIFTLEYTQPLEILPFIQRWMPDLIILEPQELKDEYIEKLQKAIDNHK
jgi:predicted DNA-binding transcriptional regulator YafY